MCSNLDVAKMITELRKKSYTEEVLRCLQNQKEEITTRIKELYNQGKRLRQETGKYHALKELEGKGLRTQSDDFLERFTGNHDELDVIISEIRALNEKLLTIEEVIIENKNQ